MASVQQYPLLTIKFAASTPNEQLVVKIDQLIRDYQNHELTTTIPTIELNH